MENTKQVGRPKGYKVSDETKAKISRGMLNYYAHMTPQQKRIRDNCNRLRGELFRLAMEKYYSDLNNNL